MIESELYVYKLDLQQIEEEVRTEIPLGGGGGLEVRYPGGERGGGGLEVRYPGGERGGGLEVRYSGGEGGGESSRGGMPWGGGGGTSCHCAIIRLMPKCN